MNSIISECENIYLFFLNNLSELDTVLIGDNDNTFENFLDMYVESIIYNNSRFINVFTNQTNFFTKDSIKVYLQLNDEIQNNGPFISIFDEKNNIYSSLFNFDLIEENILLFKFLINTSGDYYVRGYIDDGDGNHFKSNTINISSVDYNAENNQIYLNNSLLKKLSYQTGGIFYKYNDSDKFLDNIKLSTTNNVNYKSSNLLSYPSLFLILIILLSLEWYCRTRIGLI